MRRGLLGHAATQTDSVFGKRLVQARKRAGLTQNDLATALDRDRSLISHLERGHSGRMTEVLRNVARKLGVSADYLVGLTDTPNCDGCAMRELYRELHALLSESNVENDRLNDAINLLAARLDM